MMRLSLCGSERSSASWPGLPSGHGGRSTSDRGRWEHPYLSEAPSTLAEVSARSVRGRVPYETSGHHVSGMEGRVQRRGELGRQLSVACPVRDAEMSAEPDVRPERKGGRPRLADPQEEPTAEFATRRCASSRTRRVGKSPVGS